MKETKAEIVLFETKDKSVKSNRGVEFRRWANSVLRQYILQGYAVNRNRIPATMFLYFLDKNKALFCDGRK